ncbi:MAG: NUDIX hydrolase [Promethearchaeota archaeon]
MFGYPKILKNKKVYQTKWFSLHRKTVQFTPASWEEDFYSVNEGDHVTIVAEDKKGKILLIKQYRPALERYVLELPGGHIIDDNPAKSALEELFEETGYAAENISFVGKVIIDSGRNQGYTYTYYAKELRRINKGEQGIDLITVEKDEIKKLIIEGQFSHSPNLCAVFLAVLKGFLNLD